MVGLVVVAWCFAVETAVMAATLQEHGESRHTVQLLMVLSVGSLLVSVLACARAVVVFRRPPTPVQDKLPTQRTREARSRVLVG